MISLGRPSFSRRDRPAYPVPRAAHPRVLRLAPRLRSICLSTVGDLELRTGVKFRVNKPPLRGQQIDEHMLQLYVSCISDVCCICFIWMLQSRSGVAYIATAIHVWCKCMFQLFQMYVVSVLSGCCICCTGYTRMLQVYDSNISAVSNVCCKCFIWILHML
jgi:hypothetical protein